MIHPHHPIILQSFFYGMQQLDTKLVHQLPILLVHLQDNMVLLMQNMSDTHYLNAGSSAI
jgi:hypothetical protein